MPDVAPIAVEAVLADLARVDQPRQQLVPEVLRAVLAGLLGQLVERVEHAVRLEDEDLVGDQVALGVVRLVGHSS